MKATTSPSTELSLCGGHLRVKQEQTNSLSKPIRTLILTCPAEEERLLTVAFVRYGAQIVLFHTSSDEDDKLGPPYSYVSILDRHLQYEAVL